MRNSRNDDFMSRNRAAFNERLQKDLEMNLPDLLFQLLLDVDQAVFLRGEGSAHHNPPAKEAHEPRETLKLIT